MGSWIGARTDSCVNRAIQENWRCLALSDLLARIIFAIFPLFFNSHRFLTGSLYSVGCLESCLI